MTELASKMELSRNRTEYDEHFLIQAIREDPGKFGELYNLYVERVFRYLYSRTGNIQEAEDLTSQTFLTALEAISHYRQDGHFSAWLFKIAHNKAMDHFRQGKKTISLEEKREIPDVPDPLHTVMQSEQIVMLRTLIRSLTEEERELLRLRFLAEMSYEEIAHFLQRNEEAVKKSLYRLLARLQRQMEVSHE